MLNNYISLVLDLFKKEKSDVTVISKNTKFTGDLEASQVYIDGVLNTTEIESVGLVVGMTGIVTGNVSVKTLDVMGTINGNIKCDKVTIHNGATVIGNITYSSSLSIEEGALFEGNISKPKDISKKADGVKSSEKKVEKTPSTSE